MLPGVAPPPGRGPPGPGRGPPGPGRGPCGRGIGRSTGCAEENGLLPTRGGRGRPGLGAAGPGRGPGVGAAGRAGAGAAAAAGAAGAGAAGVGAAGAAGAGGAGGAATGIGAAGLGAGAWGGAVAAGASATGAGLGGATGLLAGRAGAGRAAGLSAALPPPNASRRRRATGASTVDDADLTNSPCSLNRARTSLLLTPSSLANSCTRALPGAATTSPTQEATAVVGRASGLATTHGHRRDFTVCSCSSLPVLLPGPSGPSISRSARPPPMYPVNR